MVMLGTRHATLKFVLRAALALNKTMEPLRLAALKIQMHIVLLLQTRATISQLMWTMEPVLATM